MLLGKTPNKNSFNPMKKCIFKPSATEIVQNCEHLCDFFNFFIDISMITLIIEATNRKILIHCENHPYLHKNVVEPLSIIEMRSFFGLLLLFGSLKKVMSKFRNFGLHLLHNTSTMRQQQ